MQDNFTITRYQKFTAIRCHSCNETRTFCGEEIEQKLKDFRRDHSHKPTFNKDRFVNSVIGNFGE